MKEEDIVYLASAGYDHTIRFWSPHEGKCTRVIQHSSSQVNDLKITPDKKYLAAASFQHVRMYNILNVHEHNPEINLEGFNNNVLSIGFQEDSKWLFSGGEDCVTRVWDLRHRRNQSQRMHESESAVNSVKLHQNQVELYIGQQHGHINIWDIRYTNPTPMVRLNQQHPSNYTGVQCLSLNPMNGTLAAIDNVGYVHIYSPAQTLTLFRSWKAHSRYGIKCLFSPNGKYLVTTSADCTAKVWKTCDILEENPDEEEDQPKQQPRSQSFEGISKQLEATLTIGTTSSAPSSCIKTANTPATTATTPTTTTTIATTTANTTTTTATTTTSTASTSTSSISQPSNLTQMSTVSLTPSKSPESVKHEMKPYKVLSTELQRWVWDIAFSADSQFLITASSDSIVRLWHLETAEIKREYTGHQKAVTALAFSD